MRNATGLTIIFLAAVGCSGQSVASGSANAAGTAGSSEQPHVAGDAGGSSNVGAGGVGATDPNQCGKPGDVIDLASNDDAQAHLIGKWLYCSGFVIFGVQHAGLEFATDGRWYFLAADVDGQLVRQKGFDGGGTWTLFDYDSTTNAEYFPQVSMAMAVGGNVINPAFQMNPSAMRFSSTGGFSDYVSPD